MPFTKPDLSKLPPESRSGIELRMKANLDGLRAIAAEEDNDFLSESIRLSDAIDGPLREYRLSSRAAPSDQVGAFINVVGLACAGLLMTFARRDIDMDEFADEIGAAFAARMKMAFRAPPSEVAAIRVQDS